MRVAEAGFTLLEVLVAVLMLALGMVGGVAMHLHAMRARQESALLSNAVQLAADAIERLRANPRQLASYLQLDFDARTTPVPGMPSANCFAQACDAAELAAADLYDIQRLAAAQLPGARVRLCRDGASWQGGRLRWACSADPAAPIVVKVGWQMRRPDGARAEEAGAELPVVALALGSLP
jgi:type IV pilus assembly protein PilV